MTKKEYGAGYAGLLLLACAVLMFVLVIWRAFQRYPLSARTSQPELYALRDEIEAEKVKHKELLEMIRKTSEEFNTHRDRVNTAIDHFAQSTELVSRQIARLMERVDRLEQIKHNNPPSSMSPTLSRSEHVPKGVLP